jgi:electron transport complex protein RnfG
MSEQKLPMAGQGGPDGGGGTSAGGVQPPVEVEVSSFRLVGTLTVAGALAGLAIVLVFQWAQPRIEAYQAKVLAEAVTEVLGGAARYETVFMDTDGVFKAQPQADTTSLEERIYVGFDESDNPVGVAVVGAKAGFQDVIRLIFGFDPNTGEVLGMKVLESKETPGLGDKIEKDSAFVDQFVRVATLIEGVKRGRETGADEEVVMITGATISSQAIIDIINMRVDELRGPIGTYWSSAGLLAAGNPPASDEAGEAMADAAATDAPDAVAVGGGA